MVIRQRTLKKLDYQIEIVIGGNIHYCAFFTSGTLVNYPPLTPFLGYTDWLHQCMAFRGPVTGQLIVQMLTPEAMGAVIIISAAGDGFPAAATAVILYFRN